MNIQFAIDAGRPVSIQDVLAEFDLDATQVTHTYDGNPEKKLLARVLTDAVQTIGDNSNLRRSARLEAVEWFRSDSRDWPFDFYNICEALGIDHQYFRRLMRTLDAGLKVRRQHVTGRMRMTQRQIKRKPQAEAVG